MGRTSDARQRLIDAAYNLVWEQSYGAVTIDLICERAKVQKGSFYHFFESKPELVLAAINDKWEEREHFLLQVFSPEIAPLNRILAYFDEVGRRQRHSYELTGRVLGCPYYSLGIEISMREETLRLRIAELYQSLHHFFLIAIREAQHEGDIPPGNADTKARIVLGLWQGTLSRARIENKIHHIENFAPMALEILGVRPMLSLAV